VGLPDTLVVKLPTQDPSVHDRVSFAYVAEHSFYTSLADKVDLPIPHCYHCDVAGEGAEFVLVMEDLAPAVRGDQVAGCTGEQAMLAVAALAGLHGPLWCDPSFQHVPGSAFLKPEAATAQVLGEIMQTATEITLQDLTGISDDDQDTLGHVAAVTRDWLLLEPGRFCVLHGDYRLDNLLFDPEATSVAVVDWQSLAVGLPGRNFAYFVGTGLAPDLRGEIERDLLRAYHQKLLTYGIADYGFDTCWQDYRLGLLQAPIMAALGFAFAAATERGDDAVRAMLSRSCQAIRELESLELIDYLISR
jgi:aminoglycoside phosphotransferase (APT) family kinase protein